LVRVWAEARLTIFESIVLKIESRVVFAAVPIEVLSAAIFCICLL
jgi:hypothetical protein